MAINDELLYEIDERGQRVVVKSLESTQRVYLRFTNRTNQAVDIWWRDYNGVRRHYVRIGAGTYYDVNSFITHPWEFRDAATKEVYYVNNKAVFRPPPNTGGMMYRTNWNICIGMRTLRETVLLTIASKVLSADVVQDLGLPRELQHELQDLVTKIHNVAPLLNE